MLRRLRQDLLEHVQHLDHGLFKVSEDPFASVEITALESQEKQEENNTDDFCDVCGQSLPSEQVISLKIEEICT